jgi:hypothetical protein
MTRQELLKDVKKVLDHDGRCIPFGNNMPGKDWVYGFSKRNPGIAQRTAKTYGHQRTYISKEMVDEWFTNLNDYLKVEVPDWKRMINDPRRCFYADKSGFPICINTGKVLAEKGVRHVYQVTTSTKRS